MLSLPDNTSSLDDELHAINEKYYLKAEGYERDDYSTAKVMRAAIFAVENTIRKIDHRGSDWRYVKAIGRLIRNDTLMEYHRINHDENGYAKDLIDCYARDIEHLARRYKWPRF